MLHVISAEIMKMSSHKMFDVDMNLTVKITRRERITLTTWKPVIVESSPHLA